MYCVPLVLTDRSVCVPLVLTHRSVCVPLVLTHRSTSASTNMTPSNRFTNDSLHGHGARPGWRLLILAHGEVGKTTSLLVAHVV